MNNWNLNYPDYNQGFGGASPRPMAPQDPSTGYLTGMAQGGATGAATGSAFGPYGAAIGAGIGAATSAYGTYVQSQQAEADYERAMQAWREEEARARRSEAANAQQRMLQNNLTSGNYARSLSQDIQAPYMAYARGLGL